MRNTNRTPADQPMLPFPSEQASETPRLRQLRNGPPEPVAALDIGTSKITCMIARAENDMLKILAVHNEMSRGIERGEIVDLEQAAEATAAAIAKAQSMANIDCDRFFVGLASKHCKGQRSDARIKMAKENQVISEKLVSRALNTARNVSLPPDRRIIDSVPQSFTVDDVQGVRQPKGMMGNQFTAEVYLVMESLTAIRNFSSCLRMIGCREEGLLFKPFATAEAVLTEDEKKIGTAHIDIGEGTMDVVLYYGDAPRYVRVLPVGGGHIARDVAIGLSTTISAAHQIVREFGVAGESMLTPAEVGQLIDVPSVDQPEPHQYQRRKLAFIIECRIDEMLDIAKKEIQRAGFGNHCSRVVITGGSASLRGIARKAKQIFGVPARIGRPKLYTDHPDICDDPGYATAVGLLVYGIKVRRVIEEEDSGSVFSVAARSFRWLKEFF